MYQKNIWKILGGRVFTPSPFALFGIVNITPDSFSDGGKFFNAHEAMDQAQTLWQEGADILDLGAESSRPGAAPLTAKEELKRLLPVLSPLAQKNHWPERKNICQNAHLTPLISVDTYHAETAKAVLEAGAHIINDISACLFDPALLEVVAEYKPGYVLMHSTGRPSSMQQNICSAPIMDTLNAFFNTQLQRLTKAGLPEEHIMLDPGIGFGKSVEQNWEILQNITKLQSFGRPILAALSMKSFLHKRLHLDTENLSVRAEATALCTAMLGAKGIVYHRVHHAAQNLRALHIAHALIPY